MHQRHPARSSLATVITGATGFVGGELVRKLLRESNRTLICPIRAGSDAEAAERGNARLEALVGPEAAGVEHRVRWIRGDIEEPRFGWSDARWHDIASQTCEVFHCAASVSFDLPLDQAHRINVGGTKHVHALAVAAADRHGSFERFHHVSTAFVAGRTKGRVSSDFLPPDRARRFRNTYERTKARAERYLRAEASLGVPVTIHRPSIIAGDSHTGRTTNWNVLYVPMKMVARGALPAFAYGGRQLVDSIAVDVLVDAMVTFSQLDSGRLESHHITAGPTAFTVTDVIRSTIERAAAHGGFAPSKTRLLSRGRWRVVDVAVTLAQFAPRRLGSIRDDARSARRCIDRCSVYLPYTMVDTIFDADRDHDLLRVFGVEMPAGPRYLETILDYALAIDFGSGQSDGVAPSSVDLSVA